MQKKSTPQADNSLLSKKTKSANLFSCLQHFLKVKVLLPGLLIYLIAIFSATAQNPIVTENALTGNPASEWDINQAGDLSIQGFATDISYNKGETAVFKIKTDAAAYTIQIYRLGYYQGNGARFIANATVTATLPQTQPACISQTSSAIKLVDCGNWAVSGEWAIPSNAVSGYYIAKLTRSDTQGSSHIIFIVRDDASTSDLLFQSSDATWQAYNGYDEGSNNTSLYTGPTSLPSGHSAKVSYNRPFITRTGGAGGGPYEDYLFNSEYPMIRFLEKNGYDVTYTTNIDTDRRGNLIQNHKVFLSVGHDEYWSKAMKDNVAAARNAGVHLAFFSGNEVYWKTRWENSIDGNGTPFRTLVCYKEGPGGENTTGVKSDPSPEWTGLWRYGCAPEYNPATNNACLPENELTGQISWDGTTSTIVVPSDYKNLRFWRNTVVANLGTGQTHTLTENTLGYEWDWEQEEFRSSYPLGRIILSKTIHNGRTHHLSLYKHSSGALVFGAGTVQWTWGLDENHDRFTGETVNLAMQQATVNVLADMGVQPVTLQNDLVAATASTDTQAPISLIVNPLNNADIPNNTPITISGTASDAGGTLAGVEVSTDGGTTWKVASGTTNWTFNWIPTTVGTATIKARGFDDSGNIENPTTPGSNVLTVNVVTPPPPTCPCTLFFASTAPSTGLQNDGQPIQVGMKFRSSEAGFITGTRFYKQTGNNGTHTAQLHDNAGNLLAQSIFTNESTSGWQETTFANPVAITANTVYIISYHSSNGHYSADDNGFTLPIVNGYLYAFADNEITGGNGVYKYGTLGFPNQNFEESNYFVDIVFNTEVGPDNTPPTVLLTSPLANAINVNINANISITFSEAINPSTVTASNFFINSVSSAISYHEPSRTVTLNPNSSLNYATNYTITIQGEAGGVEDLAGNDLEDDFSFNFTTQNQPAGALPDPNEGPGGPILVVSSNTNLFSRYAVEILRAEGFNEFTRKDISEVSASLLNNYDIVILGEIPLNASEAGTFSNWVNDGGTLITFRPDANLYNLLGITSAGGTLSDKYLAINNSGAGVGIVNQSMQFHSEADLYNLNGATALAFLYSNANTATTNPAVTINNVGSNGGKAIAFAFDLGKSIVYTRQGNPAWAGQKRDGEQPPIRSDDMFYPDWIDFNKVQIPQADEQQRFLANLILQSNAHKKPLPRFWYLPRKLKAAVVMTGDDHANGGTIGRFNQYLQLSPSNTAQAVADWTAIRGTSYIYPGTPITDAQALAFENQGFEISLHLNTNCALWIPNSLRTFFDNQMADLAAQFPSILPPITHRTHCISWSDWATTPIVQVERGIRLDANYYYWPSAWVQNRPGMFTGSGFPMRFADLDGSLIDCYQLTTQMTDESGITYSTHINTLLDNAIGSNAYYGVFCANMHTDQNGGNSTQGSDAIISSAQARNIPVISAKQMLTWLDGRNNSNFGAMTWNGNALSFTASVFSGANFIYGMLPYNHNGGQLTSLTLNGGSVNFTTEIIKGINYAFFPVNNGNYVATYSIDNQPPQISNINATPVQGGTATITWTTDENATSQVIYGTDANNLNLTASDNNLVNSHSLNLTGLTGSTIYYYRVISTDANSNTTTHPNSPANPLSFNTPAPPNTVCFTDQTSVDFTLGSTGANTAIVSIGDGAISLKPALSEDFSGNTIPAGWNEAVWDGQGGAITTYSNGQVTVNGTHLNSNSSFAPGASIEFMATYTAENFQNVGFSADADFNSPWMTIGRGNVGGDNGIYARNSNGEAVILGSNLLNTPHKYKIQWNQNGTFAFYVDDVLIATPGITQSINSNMVIQISDYPAGGNALSVDWISVTPFASSGIFQSRVYDAGSQKNWLEANFSTETPAGTSTQVSQRQGNTATPDGTWTVFSAITNGNNVGGTSRYIQYQVNLSTNNTSLSPLFKDITIACESPSNATPQITLQPLNQTVCEGGEVSFSSTASGVPAPTVQWQVSTDNGNTWNDVNGATNGTLTFNTASGDNGKKYRAVWTNTQGSTNSDEVTLTVYALPTATIALVENQICDGENISLQLQNATGTAPFDLIVNGITYENVNIGQTFATFDPIPTQSVWANNFVPGGNLSVSDGVSIEVGVKFRTSVSGYVKGVRFYKGATNTGTHIGKLWSNTGTLLSSTTFTNESADGWQEVRFANPVFIQANTTFIASYFSQSGFFAIQPGFFSNGNSITNGNITLLANGTDGANGVFLYGGGFPTSNGNGSNYSVDVVFSALLTSPLNVNFELTSLTDANNCVNTGSPLQSLNASINTLPNGTIAPVQATILVGQTANLVFTATNENSPFSLTINGNTYSNVQSGTPFSVGVPNLPPPSPVSIWDNNVIGGEPTAVDNDAIEVGLKFRATVAGTINGIRFYKRIANTGTHTGTLWTSAGQLLATATFSNETASGWQSVIFSTPVAIQPNVTYIASYHAPNGQYAFSANFFTNSGLTNGVLRALQSGEAGSGTNGLYKYSGGGVFPNESFNDANYWVDVLFEPNGQLVNYNLTQIEDANCTNTVNSKTSVFVEYDTQAPSAPVLSVGTITENSIQLNWTASSDNVGVTEYEIFQGANSVGTTANLTFTVSGLNPATAYTFTVKAKDAKGNVSAPSNTVNPSTTDITPPSPPTLSLGTVGETSVQLNWTASTDNVAVTEYEIFQNNVSIGTTPNLTLTVSGLNPSTNYNFTVKAKDAAGNSSTPSNTVSPTTTDTTAPTAPTLSLGTIGETTVQLNWTASTDNVGVTEYEIFNGANSVGTTTNLTFTVTGLSPATAYTFTVKAKDAAGNTSMASNDVNATTTDVTAPTPPVLSAGDITETTIELNWTASTDNVGVTEYEIFQNNVSIGTTNNLTFTVSGLTACTAYSFTVKAKDAANNVSEASNVLNVNTIDTTAPITPTLANATGECLVTVTAPSTTDNCAGTITGTTNSPLIYNNQGTFQITWTFDDGNGNATTAIQNIIVDDVTAPLTPTLATATGECSVTVTAPSTTDNCAGTITGTTNSPLIYNNQGTFQITWTFDDGNGNATTAIQNVIVDDVTAPIITLNGNATITLEAGSSYNELGATATDNCSTNLTVIFEGDVVNPLVVGTYIITYNVSDGAGNPAIQETRTVKVEDNTSPTSPTLSLGTITETTVQLNWTASTDNVGVTEYEIFQNNVSIGTKSNLSFTVNGLNPSTAYTFTVKAKDAEGNVSAPSNVVNPTTIDITAPNPPVLSLGTIGETSVVLNWTASTDNVGVTEYEIFQNNVSIGTTSNLTFTAMGLNPVSNYTFTVKAKDAAGNVSNPSNAVNPTTIDITAPIAKCKNITIQLNASGQASITAQQIDDGSTDNSGQAPSLSINKNAFDCSNLGQNTVTLTAKDASNNQSTCAAIVTVVDNIAPTALCKNIQISLDANGTASITPAMVNNGSSDNCGITNYELDNTEFTSVGTYQVVLTLIDQSGNQSTCNATVEVNDTGNPIAKCTNISLLLNAQGQGSITPQHIDNGSSDNSGQFNLSIDKNAFNCTNLGVNHVVLTVTDPSGNSATCTAAVIVEDQISPNALCKNITVALDANGEATITPAMVNNGSSDNCSITSLSIDKSDFTAADLGANTVELTVQDQSGNIATCIATVMISDEGNPTAKCKNITVQLNAQGQASITPQDIDDGSSDNGGTVNLSINKNSFDCTNIGANIVTLTVIDGSGNTATCTATVTVEDKIAPTVLCKNITVVLDATGNIAISPSMVNNGSSDNCGTVNLSLNKTNFTCADLGQQTVILTVSDSQGNFSTCSATVNVTALPTVLSFTLVNALTDTDLMPLSNGMNIDLNSLPTRNLNIRANTCPATVGSVRLNISGPINHTLTENTAPYALFGDFPLGNYAGRDFAVGTYQLTGTPYPLSNAGGTVGNVLSVQLNFTENVPNYQLTLLSDANGSASVNPPGSSFPVNTQLSVSALANSGYQFKNWTNENNVVVSVQNPYNFTISQNTTLKANFEIIVVPNPTVSSLRLIDAQNDQIISTLSNGQIFHLSSLPSSLLSIEALTTGTVGSVYFQLSGPINRTRTDNSNPYLLYNNTGSNYSGATFGAGNYVIKATPYSLVNRGGTAGATLTINFTILSTSTPYIPNLTLINAATDIDIRTMIQNEIVDLNVVGNSLNIRANIVGTGTKSVRFILKNESGQILRTQIENIAPYALYGDNLQGNYNIWTPFNGKYLLEVLPFKSSNATGTVGVGINLNFEVINGAVAKGLGDVISGSFREKNLEVEQVELLNIYPNPLTGKQFTLVFSAPVSGELMIRLMDVFGKEIYFEKRNLDRASKEIVVNLEKQHLPIAVYFLQLEADNLPLTNRKIVK